MTKGYWIAQVDVSDKDGYQAYAKAISGALVEHGAKFLTRGGAYDAVEGDSRSRNVIIEFPSYENALACYQSAEYQAAVSLRHSASEGQLVIVEGYDGLQPGDSV